jgi:hypothetical protein
VAGFVAEVGDVGSGGLEDPQAQQAQQAEHGDEGGVVVVGGLAGGGEQCLELQVGPIPCPALIALFDALGAACADDESGSSRLI